MTETITVEKKVFDVLQKNNLDLMEKLEKAKEALRYYANPDTFATYFDCPSKYDNDGGYLAQETLEELEK